MYYVDEAGKSATVVLQINLAHALWAKSCSGYLNNLNVRDVKSPCTSAPQCIGMQAFLNSSELLTISCSQKTVMMISQTVQELSCWQTHKDKRTDTTENNIPPRYAIAVLEFCSILNGQRVGVSPSALQPTGHTIYTDKMFADRVRMRTSPRCPHASDAEIILAAASRWV